MKTYKDIRIAMVNEYRREDDADRIVGYIGGDKRQAKRTATVMDLMGFDVEKVHPEDSINTGGDKSKGQQRKQSYSITSERNKGIIVVNQRDVGSVHTGVTNKNKNYVAVVRHGFSRSHEISDMITLQDAVKSILQIPFDKSFVGDISKNDYKVLYFPSTGDQSELVVTVR